MDFQDAKALITDCNKGINYAAAKLLKAKGAQVVDGAANAVLTGRVAKELVAGFRAAVRNPS